MSQLSTLYRRFHKAVNEPHAERLIILLALMLVLRLPNLTEPYWYGDEGIYLTIGAAMRHGEKLYSQIIDHKTPIIYYLAMVPTQFDFRLLLLAWMFVTTICFYYITVKWFKHWLPGFIATLVFVIFTTLPFLEGNIPNGELFVMGFVMVAGAILTSLPLWHEHTDTRPHLQLSDIKKVFLAGIFLGLGVLTKVPAVFDFAAFLGLGWFSAIHQLSNHTRVFTKAILQKWATYLVVLSLGMIAAVAASVVYFVLRGSGQAYLDFGLLYNFHYVENWSLPFKQNWLLFLFSLKGKILVLAIFGLVVSWLSRKASPIWATIVTWVVLALVAANLSNRPYPHYLLQVIPPLALLMGCLVEWGMNHHLTKIKLKELIISIFAIVLVALTWRLLGFGGYETVEYYVTFGQLLTHQITPTQYAENFNPLIRDNNQVTDILRQSAGQYFFVWGTDPMLYALSGKQPVGRFTVSFHIQDLNAYQETLDAITAKQPEYIAVMNDEAQSFPALNQYLQLYYMPNTQFERLVLWKLKK